MSDDREIEGYLRGLAARLPSPAGRVLAWLRRPQGRWTRRAAALPLIAAGPFGFLPVLGFWMLPIGILLLAEDIPALRRATVRAIMRAERLWQERRRR